MTLSTHSSHPPAPLGREDYDWLQAEGVALGSCPSRPLACLTLIVTLLSFFVPLLTQATTNQTLYQTSFEPPVFTPGLPIRGQDNWEMFHNGEAISISTTNARTGAQCVRMDGALLEPVGPSTSVASCFSTLFRDNPPPAPPPIVELTAWVRLDGPQTGTNGASTNDLMSAIFTAVGQIGETPVILGSLGLSSAGRIFTIGSRPEDDYRFSAPMTFGAYHKLVLRVDFIGRTLRYFVDDAHLGFVNFRPGLTADRLASGYLRMSGAIQPLTTPYHYDRADYTAYFDDYSIVSIPLSPVNAIVEFASTNVLTDEYEATVRVVLVRRGFTNAAVRVTVSTTNDTAVAGEDYVATTTFVTFAAGETNKVVEIPLTPDDDRAESDKAFLLRIGGLPPGVTSPRAIARVVIRDNERPGSIDSTWRPDLGLSDREAALALPFDQYGNGGLGVIPPSDGKMIVDVSIYDSEDYNWVTNRHILRLNVDGSIDPTFPIRSLPPSVAGGAFYPGNAPLSDGALLVWSVQLDRNRNSLAFRVHFRLRQDGSIDETFARGVTMDRNGEFPSFLAQPDGKVLVYQAAGRTLYDGRRMPWLFRLNADGGLDTNFTVNAGPVGDGVTIDLLPDGRFLAYSQTLPNLTNQLRRFNADGSLDAMFRPPTNTVPRYRLIYRPLPNGQLLLVATSKLNRLNQDGSIDPTFTAGTASIDNSNLSIERIELQDDGRIVLFGFFKTYNGVTVNGIVRLEPNGAIDPTFRSGHGFGHSDVFIPSGVLAEGIRPLSRGRFLVGGGNFNRYDGQPVTLPIILNADGTRDVSFVASPVDWPLNGDLPYIVGMHSDRPIVWTGTALRRLNIATAASAYRITTVSRDGAGVTRLSAQSQSGQRYTLQSSETLTNWIDLTTRTATTNRIDFTDAPTNAFTHRFYRVKQD